MPCSGCSVLHEWIPIKKKKKKKNQEKESQKKKKKKKSANAKQKKKKKKKNHISGGTFKVPKVKISYISLKKVINFFLKELYSNSFHLFY